MLNRHRSPEIDTTEDLTHTNRPLGKSTHNYQEKKKQCEYFETLKKNKRLKISFTIDYTQHYKSHNPSPLQSHYEDKYTVQAKNENTTHNDTDQHAKKSVYCTLLEKD
jgi:hypothetical protein